MCRPENVSGARASRPVHIFPDSGFACQQSDRNSHGRPAGDSADHQRGGSLTAHGSFPMARQHLRAVDPLGGARGRASLPRTGSRSDITYNGRVLPISIEIFRRTPVDRCCLGYL